MANATTPAGLRIDIVDAQALSAKR